MYNVSLRRQRMKEPQPEVTCIKKNLVNDRTCIVLVTACEKVLLALDMSLNAGKSCMRIESRFDKPCANVCTHDGRQLSWVKELRYLGFFIVSSRNFKCSLDHAKRSFYHAANSIFGKIGRIASEDVLIELLKTKCMPVLLYVFEVCNLCKRDLYSLDFVVNRFF